MSNHQVPTISIETFLTSSDISPIKLSSMQTIESSRFSSKFKDNDKKIHLFPLPDLQIKKSKTLLPPSLDSGRKASPFKSDSTKLKIASSDCVYRHHRKKKKSVYIPKEHFVEIVEIESFKQYNFIEKITAKEYDVFSKRCCSIF